MVNATPEELSLCPGLGDVKVRRLREAFTTPFRGGPPPSTTKAGNLTQRALDEMGIDRLTASTKGKGRAAPSARESSPDWPSDDNDDDERFPAAADVGRKQPRPVGREPSPDWPSDDEDEPLIDVDDLLAEPTGVTVVRDTLDAVGADAEMS
jgi:hypothetical protein